MAHSNHLATETSPYLLQHARNPVDWYPWGEEALGRAKKENKPILVSIGYAACHWCHVMERESFEDESTARLMNEHFVNIKIDREERPDLDHIYMDAVQAMTGGGGWPLNVFLTPEGKPFYGGTYFPPKAVGSHPAWKDVLMGVASAYQQTPSEIAAQAEQLTSHLLQSNAFGLGSVAAEAEIFTRENLDLIYSNMMQNADRHEGGFGGAPKFPQTFAIEYLLSYFAITKNQQALDHALMSIDKMIYGGIYDQAGGGFARYATDARWLVPHFEKMLYDNALLLVVISEAYQVTHRELYRDTIEDTITFLEREMLSPENGFYSALDADSEGEEGKFYVWSKEEVDQLLGKDAPIFCDFYDVTVKGNWEGKNILHILVSPEAFAKKHGLDVEELKRLLQEGRDTLLQRRSQRARPQLDDKILLGWNALMNIALCKAYAATGNTRYKTLARKNMDFMLDKFHDVASGGYFHTYKNNKAKFPAFLDDYALLVRAMISLQEITGDVKYLQKAKQITGFILQNFSDEVGLLFYFTHRGQQDVVIRKKEIYDGATPSGNSIMAWNLLYLGVIFDNDEWKKKVEEMLKALFNAITKYPTSFGAWASTFLLLADGIKEIVVIGEAERFLEEILHIFIPSRILQVSAHDDDDFPLLKGKRSADKPLIFLCKNYVCLSPLDNIPALIRALEM